MIKVKCISEFLKCALQTPHQEISSHEAHYQKEPCRQARLPYPGEVRRAPGFLSWTKALRKLRGSVKEKALKEVCREIPLHTPIDVPHTDLELAM